MTFTVTRQRAQEVHDLAIARDGLPYAYGGAFTRDPKRSTDCSGLVMQTAAWYGGRNDWPGNRYGSTESFRLDHAIVYQLGFKRLPRGGVSALPIKPVMLVGLQHGGGGVYSHTACTLMTMDKPGGPVKMSDRGVDWESQGNGVFLYDGARAWNDSLFHDFWYLDAVLDGSTTKEPTVSETLYPSVSIYKNPGEGPKYTLAQLVQSIDGFAHREAVERAALAGSLDDIDRIFRVAAGRGEYRDAWTVNHAKNVLIKLEKENKDALVAYRKSKGIE